MKKIFSSAIVLLSTLILHANPVVPPSNFVLSELTFDSIGKWVIELKFIDEYILQIRTEDIYISSLSGFSEFKQLNNDAIRQIKFLKISNDSLKSDLTINPAGDKISVYLPYADPIMSDLVFGNVVTASVRSPKVGESIALFGENYSIDTSPTIGAENDTTGMCGTIKGKIFDPYHLLPPDVWLAGNGISGFKVEADGTFSARITSFKHRIDKLYYSATVSEFSTGYYMVVTPVAVTTEPDSVVNVDFHIYDIVSSVKNVTDIQTSLLNISPNPVEESFNYEIAVPVKSNDCYLEIISINGQKIAQYPVSENSGKINLPSIMMSGTYTVRLFVNNKNYANSKILIIH